MNRDVVTWHCSSKDSHLVRPPHTISGLGPRESDGLLTITDRTWPAGLSVLNSLGFMAYDLSGRDMEKQTARCRKSKPVFTNPVRMGRDSSAPTRKIGHGCFGSPCLDEL